MNNTPQRLRASTLTTGLSLFVFASGALFAGCSGNAETSESVAAQQAALLTIPLPDASINYTFGTSIAADNQTLIVGDDRALAPDEAVRPRAARESPRRARRVARQPLDRLRQSRRVGLRHVPLRQRE
jgi:hypothetical protein